jgi:hypothetical protein
MVKKSFVFIFVFLLSIVSFGFSQSHVSVPLENDVYYVIDNALSRGLCSLPPSAKPWSENTVKKLLNEMLASSKLSVMESDVVNNLLAQFEQKPGLNLKNGKYYSEKIISNESVLSKSNENNSPDKITVDAGLTSALSGSGAYYFDQEEFWGGFDLWLTAHVGGDLGKYVSYYGDIGVALISAERENLGSEKVMVNDPANTDVADMFSYPLGFFPYSYESSWSGLVFPLKTLDDGEQAAWADSASIGFNLFSEISGAFFNDILQWRVGRNYHEAAGIVEGSSLVLNKAAQPFAGYELQFNPLSGLNIYSLTGGLEFFGREGNKESAEKFQNAFSLTMLSYNFKNYAQIDVGTVAVWPKRFELGYLLPFSLPLLYQNNIGDFDNVSLFGNLKLQYPGLGFLWFSLYVDEMEVRNNFFHLDREMYAFQTGLRWNLPFLNFSTFTVSYTKIEPYCYTHPKTNVPWYGSSMEESYTNHGYGLGYYLPPNSDELKLAFNTIVSEQTSLDVQFQMIRHGADYGSQMVDGSSYLSEMKYKNLTSDSILRKDFLNDGAYQWLYVLKAGSTYKLKNLPIEFSLNAGAVFSYWTLDDKIIDDNEYPSRNGIVADIGVRIFY